MDDKLYGFTVEKSETSEETFRWFRENKPDFRVPKHHLRLTMTTRKNEDIHLEGFGDTEDEAKKDLMKHVIFMTSHLSAFRIALENDLLEDILSRYNS